MKTIAAFFFCAILVIYQFFAVNVALADEWGLEEQATERDKSDSIILRYDGKTWEQVYRGLNVWLNAIYGFADNDIFAIGEHGVILHYDGKSWSNQESP